MRDYAKVVPAFWTSGSGKALRGDPQAQVIALYLFTAPGSSMIGLYYVPFTTICHETGLAQGAVRASLRRLSELNVAHYDENDGIVWVPEMARYQIAPVLKADDKRVKGILREVVTFRKHKFFRAFVARYDAAYCLGLGIEGASSDDLLHRDPSEAPSEPLRSQDNNALVPAPGRAPAPAPEGGEGGGVPPNVRVGGDSARRSLPADSRSLAGPEASVVYDALSADPSLKPVATYGLANRIAGQVMLSKKPMAEVVASIRAAAKVAGDREAADHPMIPQELVALVCNYAEKPRPDARRGQPWGRDAKQPDTGSRTFALAEDTPP